MNIENDDPSGYGYSPNNGAGTGTGDGYGSIYVSYYGLSFFGNGNGIGDTVAGSVSFPDMNDGSGEER